MNFNLNISKDIIDKNTEIIIKKIQKKRDAELKQLENDCAIAFNTGNIILSPLLNKQFYHLFALLSNIVLICHL